MAHQSLDHEEILNVRWATQDPNPLAQKREARRIEEQAAEAVRRALPAEFVAEIEGRDPGSMKRQRLEGSYGSYALEGSQSKGAIEGTESVPLIENEAIPDGEEEQLAVAEETPERPQENGILSSSTIAALKGYTVRKGGTESTNTAGQGLTGSLVAYDSDEDSD